MCGHEWVEFQKCANYFQRACKKWSSSMWRASMSTFMFYAVSREVSFTPSLVVTRVCSIAKQLTLSTRRHGDASATVIPSLLKYTISKSNILTWINAAVQLVVCWTGIFILLFYLRKRVTKPTWSSFIALIALGSAVISYSKFVQMSISAPR